MKFIKKKLINNKEYYYFEIPLRINDNKYTYTKYIGQYLPSNLKEIIKLHFQVIGKFVSDKITNNTKKQFPPNSVEKIENARFKYHMINHELFKKDLDLFRTLFYILFVLNSNRSEGSKVTRHNIEEVIKRKVTPKTIIEKEIINSMNAINFAFSKNMNWNQKSIKTIHSKLFWNIHPEIAGKYKIVDVVVSNSPTSNWKDVSKEIEALLDWFNENKNKIYAPILALEFHWKFEAIHPFEDGNGRVGRILLNAFLIEKGYAPVVYFTENHLSYCNAIEKARSGKKIPLAKHFVESVVKTENAIEKYKNEEVVKGGSSKIGKWELQKGSIRMG